MYEHCSDGEVRSPQVRHIEPISYDGVNISYVVDHRPGDPPYLVPKGTAFRVPRDPRDFQSLMSRSPGSGDASEFQN
jgi:hypothetical protein